MWVFTEDGFLSAVRDTSAGKYRGMMVIRARSKADLERFTEKYADGKATEIHTTGPKEFRDYGWRVWMQPEDFGAALARVAEAVEYSNFKSQVARTLGWPREKMLHDVWSTMSKLQPGGAYGVGGTERQTRGGWVSETVDTETNTLFSPGGWHGDDPEWAARSKAAKKGAKTRKQNAAKRKRR